MRFRWFLALSSVLLAVIGTTVVIADRLDDGAGGGDQVVDVPDGGTTAPSTDGSTVRPTGGDGTVTVPAAGEVTVTGTLTALHVDRAVPKPPRIDTPLTLVSDRGFGNGGEVTGVTIAGKDSAIVWDGGRPFVLSSGPGLVLDPSPVDLTAEGLRFTLGGGVHALAPGSYRLNTPVAVGSAGVATSRDAVSFDAGDAARFEGSGDTALVLGPTGPHRLLGPGVVHLEGRLTVTDSGGTARSVTTFDAVRGPFDLVITPAATGGWTITATTKAP